jgi:hypothetical protein
MLYFIVTASLFNECDIRKNQYITCITKLKAILKGMCFQDYMIIVVENNGLRNTILDTLGVDVFYTNNNTLPIGKGDKELKDIIDCIQMFNINDSDFIVKITGRYILEDRSEFMNILQYVDSIDCHCLIKFGPYYSPVDYKVNDCITGLIGMRCYLIKQIEPNFDKCIEWNWAKVAYSINDDNIYIVNTLGINICPGTNSYFLV